MVNIKRKDLSTEIQEHLRTRESMMDTASNIAKSLNEDGTKIYNELMALRNQDLVVKAGNNWILRPSSKSKYIDWNGNLSKMRKFYDLKIPCLCIGNKGSGKSECTQQLAKELSKKLYTVNLSLRCRESHIIGRLDMKENNGIQEIYWKKGPMPLSMEEGNMLYLDELSAGEPDVLLRLDESLDSRRQLNYEGEELIAHPDWWCTASINPLSTPGTKELPPQLISRFTARLHFDYPDIETELKIAGNHFPIKDRNTLYKLIQFYQQLRKSEEIPYAPSLRETIVSNQLLSDGMDLQTVLQVIAYNPIKHWDDQTSEDAVRQMAQSMGL